jgi:hypothetical protein
MPNRNPGRGWRRNWKFFLASPIGKSVKRIGALVALVLAAAGANAAEMIAEPLAQMQGLDKITARVSQFNAPVGANFFTLSIEVRECQRSAPEDRPENAAFVEIYESRPGEEKERLFSGWMFSSSPALSALDHAVYDVNLLACRPASGSLPPSVPAAPAAPASPPGKSRGNTPR